MNSFSAIILGFDLKHMPLYHKLDIFPSNVY